MTVFTWRYILPIKLLGLIRTNPNIQNIKQSLLSLKIYDKFKN